VVLTYMGNVLAAAVKASGLHDAANRLRLGMQARLMRPCLSSQAPALGHPESRSGVMSIRHWLRQ
jgi:hypothetical protein